MQDISDEQFHSLMNEAMASLPKSHIAKLKNVALLLEDDVSEETRQKMNLAPDTTLLGLYQGVPLAVRQGQLTTLPDTITLYKQPILRTVYDLPGLKRQIRHTLWHEIAHYYGLNHTDIHNLEG
jgi:predicted Zn-dependent protease with MMP-like domain